MTTVRSYINTVNMLKWIEDLETTDEPQSQGRLYGRADDGSRIGYCCLGRACEVAGLRRVQSGQFGGPRTDEYVGSHATMGGAATAWLSGGNTIPDVNYGAVFGVSSGGDVVVKPKNNGLSRTGASMNDNEGLTFKQIAAVLRETFELPKISLLKLQAEIRRLAYENPAFVYERDDISRAEHARDYAPTPYSCQYINTSGAPGCIFGHAFTNLGWLEAVKLARQARTGSGAIENIGVHSVLTDLLTDYGKAPTSRQRLLLSWFGHAQYKQVSRGRSPSRMPTSRSRPHDE
jgi:hypothetical protein